MTGLPELGSPTSGEVGLRRWTLKTIETVKLWSRTLVAGAIPIKPSVNLGTAKNVQEALDQLAQRVHDIENP